MNTKIPCSVSITCYSHWPWITSTNILRPKDQCCGSGYTSGIDTSSNTKKIKMGLQASEHPKISCPGRREQNKCKEVDTLQIMLMLVAMATSNGSDLLGFGLTGSYEHLGIKCYSIYCWIPSQRQSLFFTSAPSNIKLLLSIFSWLPSTNWVTLFTV